MNKVLIKIVSFVLITTVIIVLVLKVVIPALNSQKNVVQVTSAPVQTTNAPTQTSSSVWTTAPVQTTRAPTQTSSSVWTSAPVQTTSAPTPVQTTSAPAPDPNQYELYGKYIWPPRQVQHVAFVPSINQYVFMAVTVDPASATPYFLKMVSQDNKQARYITADKLTVASETFDPLKWNNGYGVIDGNYNVRLKCPRPTTDVYTSPTLTPSGLNPDNFELYGDYISPPRPVQHIAFVPSLNQNVFMAITLDPKSYTPCYLKMVTQDNLQARYVVADPMNTASTLFDPSKWNNGYGVIDGHYKVRAKCIQ